MKYKVKLVFKYSDTVHADVERRAIEEMCDEEDE